MRILHVNCSPHNYSPQKVFTDKKSKNVILKRAGIEILRISNKLPYNLEKI